jgi:hypothetical protein
LIVEKEVVSVASCEWYPAWRSELRGWIHEHPEKLPLNWSDLGRFPMVVRRVLVNEVRPELRIQLWREHLESFLLPEAGLTQAQRDMIVAAIPELPKLLSAHAPNPAMVEFEQRIATVFSRPEAGRIFGHVGPPVPPRGVPFPPDVPRPPSA